jgi:predicted amidohydrolase YtcJ
VGALADFVLLDRDIISCPEDDILDTVVVQTYFGGEPVFTL